MKVKSKAVCLAEISNCVLIQGKSKKYDEYMRGMYNGLVLAQSILTGKEPVYADKKCKK